MTFFNTDANIPGECCFNCYARRKIPVAKIVSYRETRSDCFKPAVMWVSQLPVLISIPISVNVDANACIKVS